MYFLDREVVQCSGELSLYLKSFPLTKAIIESVDIIGAYEGTSKLCADSNLVEEVGKAIIIRLKSQISIYMSGGSTDIHPIQENQRIRILEIGFKLFHLQVIVKEQ